MADSGRPGVASKSRYQMSIVLIVGRQSSAADSFVMKLLEATACDGFMLRNNLARKDYMATIAQAQCWALAQLRPLIVFYTADTNLVNSFRRVDAIVLCVDGVRRQPNDLLATPPVSDIDEVVSMLHSRLLAVAANDRKEKH